MNRHIHELKQQKCLCFIFIYLHFSSVDYSHRLLQTQSTIIAIILVPHIITAHFSQSHCIADFEIEFGITDVWLYSGILRYRYYSILIIGVSCAEERPWEWISAFNALGKCSMLLFWHRQHSLTLSLKHYFFCN